MSDDGEDDVVELAPGSNPFERHVLVCVNGKVCPEQGSREVRDALRVQTRERFGQSAVRVNKTGCMAQCGHGPMVVVYPDNVWYAGVTVEDVPDIIEHHLVHGAPVERLLYRGHAPGVNVIED